MNKSDRFFTQHGKDGFFKAVAHILIILLALQAVQLSIFVEPVFAMSSLNLSKAISLSLSSSEAIEEIELDLVKKGMERQQAEEGLRDIRKKESTVRFSLLFNIEFPEEHGMPKEIELIMKLPKIDHEIDVLNHKLAYTKEKIKFEVTTLYLDLVLEERIGIQLNELYKMQVETVERLEKDLKLGKATQEDLDAAKEERKSLETLTAKSAKKFFSLKEKMTTKCGVDVKPVEHFDADLYMASMNRNDVPALKEMARNRDFDFYTVVQERRLSEKAVDELVDIYRSRFGSKVNRIMPEIQKQKANKAKFLKAYNSMLDAIDKPWTRVFKINLLFFTIKIPYRWFQGEFTALRYFEDQKYALFVAVLDRDKQRVTESVARQQLEEKIQSTYDTVKEMELAYRDSVSSISKEQENYSKAFEENKLGKLSFAELESARLAVINAEQTTLSNLIEYNKTIHTLNFYTVGGIKGKLIGVDFDSGVYLSGDSIPIFEETLITEQKKSSDKPTWDIMVPYTDYRFSFGIHLPTAIEATHFQLELEDGRKVGERTEVKKRLEHMPIVFTDSSVLKLKLYKDANMVYEATFEGTAYEGTLELIPVNQTAKAEQAIGTSTASFKLIDDPKTGLASLYLTLKETFESDGMAFVSAKASQSGSLDNSRPVKIVKLEDPLIGLSFVMKDYEGYLIQFYKGEEKTFIGKLIKGKTDTEGLIIVQSVNKAGDDSEK